MRKSTKSTSGFLEDVHLHEVIQMISLGRKTARLRVASGRHEGTIWFERGAAIHARAGTLRGADAFYRIMTWDRGRFEIEHDVLSRRTTIAEDTMLLMMDAIRLKDEANGGMADSGAELGDGARSAEDDGKAVDPIAPATRRLSPIAQAAIAGLGVGVLAVLVPLHLSRGASGDRDEPAVSVDSEIVDSGAEAVEVDAGDEGPMDGMVGVAETGDVEAAIPPSSDEPARGPAPAVAPQDVDDPLTVVFDGMSELPAPAALATTRDTLPRSLLALSAKSSVKEGRLEIAIDGEPVYTRELLAEHRGAARFFMRITGRAGEHFEQVLGVEPGAHEVVARLVRPDQTSVEDTITLDLAPGARTDLRLVLGRLIGKPVLLERSAGPSEDADTDPLPEEVAPVDSTPLDAMTVADYGPPAPEP